MTNRGNVTIDPLALSTPAKDLSIAEIIDLDEGVLLETRAFINTLSHEEITRLRSAVRERWKSDAPRFVCSICGVSVSLVATTEKKWFFRHLMEDGSCPSQTKGTLSQDEIRARKYHGIRESEPHKRIKNILLECLEADQSFSDIGAEKTVRSSFSTKSLRRPDVQAKYCQKLIAFEVQLSTTFLDVVIERRAFYKEEGAVLVWILPAFDPYYRRLTDDDLVFNNNNNIFVVNNEARQESLLKGRLHFLCWYREPYLESGSLTASWKSRLVAFDELTQEQERQRVFWFDYDGARGRLLATLEEDKQRWREAKIETSDNELRGDFEKFWCGRSHFDSWDAATSEAWLSLAKRLRQRQVKVPDFPFQEPNLYTFLSAIYTAKAGRVIGWRFSNILEVAHYIFDKFKMHLLAFGHAVKIYGRNSELLDHDKTGRWMSKSEKIKKSIQNRDVNYLPDVKLFPLMKILFPEIHIKLESYMAAKVA